MCSNRQGAHIFWGTSSVLLPPRFDLRVSRVQGYLWKKGQLRRNWSERWFMLKPSSLSYYMSEERKEKKGSIVLDKHCCVEVQPGPLSLGTADPSHPWKGGRPKNTQFHIHEYGRASPVDEARRIRWDMGGNAVLCPVPAGAARQGWEEVHVLCEDLIPHLRDERLRHSAAPGVDTRSVPTPRPFPGCPMPPACPH